MRRRNVYFETSSLREPLLAIFADKVFAFVVDGGDVVFEMMLTTKGPSAFLAFVLLYLFMDDFGMALQMRLVGERAATQRAREWPQFEMNRVDVLLQGSLQTTAEVARRAGERFLIPL